MHRWSLSAVPRGWFIAAGVLTALGFLVYRSQLSPELMDPVEAERVVREFIDNGFTGYDAAGAERVISPDAAAGEGSPLSLRAVACEVVERTRRRHHRKPVAWLCHGLVTVDGTELLALFRAGSLRGLPQDALPVPAYRLEVFHLQQVPDLLARHGIRLPGRTEEGKP